MEFLSSFLGLIAVGILMFITVKIAEKYKKEPDTKGGKNNRNSRRHKR
ncbi:hypothetical protein [uncultured Ilyobacter sp.]|jgi:hypothetical protein|nr:hypothetical protein [uncultured Ilyobacter sp.]